jgi:hypothetical protein
MPKSAPACPAPPAPGQSWHLEYTPDSLLSVRLPPYYQRVASGYQWAGYPGTELGGGFLSLRPLERDPLVASPPVAEWLPLGDTATKGYDLSYVEEYSACREAIGGVAAIVETGLVTGGYSDFRHTPSVRAVWWQWFGGPLALFEGTATDAEGQRELLAILRTVRFHARGPSVRKAPA